MMTEIPTAPDFLVRLARTVFIWLSTFSQCLGLTLLHVISLLHGAEFLAGASYQGPSIVAPKLIASALIV